MWSRHDPSGTRPLYLTGHASGTDSGRARRRSSQPDCVHATARLQYGSQRQGPPATRPRVLTRQTRLNPEGSAIDEVTRWQTCIDPSSESFRGNREAMTALLDELEAQLALARAGGGERSVARL